MPELRPTDTQRFLEMARKLRQRTEEGLVDWTKSNRDDRFVYSSRSSTVILETSDQDGFPPVIMRVLGPTGHVLFSRESEPDLAESDADEKAWVDVLHPLYASAWRSVVKIDDVLDELLEDLDDPSA